jgi:uncharacterized protein
METTKDYFYILSLDGGGSLGVYTLGILEEVAKLVGKPLHKKFDLIYGTSTGAIIGTLIAMGKDIDEVSSLYERYVPKIMGNMTARGRSQSLIECAINSDVFGDKKFDESSFETKLGVIATRCDYNRPMIFKSSVDLAHSGKDIFKPGFGCKISDAVIASCSAAPFFKHHKIHLEPDRIIKTFDGGFVANNPTFYAITDAMQALGKKDKEIKVLSIGVGGYPNKSINLFSRLVESLKPIRFFQTVLSSNNNATELLRKIIFPDVDIFRCDSNYMDNQYATNFLESNKQKLAMIKALGKEFYRENESHIRVLLNQK